MKILKNQTLNSMKAFCTKCKRETNHKIHHEVKRSFAEEDYQYFANGYWQIIECNGCEDVSFREVWESSDDWDPDTGQPSKNVKLYPYRSSETLSLKPYYNAPYKVNIIYREMIDAFNHGLYILCSGGLRACIEGVCISEGIKDGPIEFEKNGIKSIKRKKDLQGRISGLFEKGLLTKQHAEILHEHRFLGNEALHSLDQPSRSELLIAIEIVELTLDNLYVLNQKVSELRSRKQKRTSKKK